MFVVVGKNEFHTEIKSLPRLDLKNQQTNSAFIWSTALKSFHLKTRGTDYNLGKAEEA